MISFYRKLKPLTIIGVQLSGKIMTVETLQGAIFDTDECDAFADKLESRIRSHDRDIEKLCSAHHQGFIESIRDLLELKGLANRIHGEVQTIDSDICRSVTQLKLKGQELADARRIERNMKTTIEMLQSCLPVLRAYIKLQHQMKEKRYYPALKTLEQLEHIHLPSISHYRFSEHMKRSLAKVRESIKEASMIDLKDFLESIRKYSPKIGEVAMRHTAEQLNIDISANSSVIKRLMSPTVSGEFDYEAQSESVYSVEEDLSAQDLVDFSPVYRCLHIHTVLDAKETYENYYRKQRKKQARLALQPPTNMHETIEGYRQYFHGIVGFFVVEDHVMNTASTLVNRSYLDDVWNIAVSKIASSVRTHSSYCTDPALMLKIKNLVMLFSSTLRTYGYSVSQLVELLQEIRDHYNEVLMQRWVHVFRDIFDEDNYHPIQVTTAAEYQRVIESFPYRDGHLEAAPFPKRFPFSSLVPKVYRQIRNYIQACLQFSQDLNLADQEIDDTLRRYTNLLLTRTLSGCLSTLIRKPSLSLLQLIQISINTNYLEESNGWLEEFIAQLTGASRELSHIARLQGRAVFRDVRDDAEQQIYEALKRKMDEFMELANYDWQLNEPSGQASSFLMDLIAFLQSTFQAFTNLKEHVAQNACLTACRHIAEILMDLLLSDDVKSISMGALQQVNLDVIQCEQFAASEPVPGFEDGTLLSSFLDLRQLLDLLLSWDWSAYFHDYGQDTSKYLRVSPQRAITVLEKLREADKRTVFSVLKKSERDKKKLMETVLRQLRQLLQSSA
uniref:Exocyst complex component n=1 Tax=Daphnia pulicaria TaxID=35523 RepID=A0A4Y7MXH3_9CRUS|nr:EOG090X01NK [Daphnia pulicaria]